MPQITERLKSQIATLEAQASAADEALAQAEADSALWVASYEPEHVQAIHGSVQHLADDSDYVARYTDPNLKDRVQLVNAELEDWQADVRGVWPVVPLLRHRLERGRLWVLSPLDWVHPRAMRYRLNNVRARAICRFKQGWLWLRLLPRRIKAWWLNSELRRRLLAARDAIITWARRIIQTIRRVVYAGLVWVGRSVRKLWASLQAVVGRVLRLVRGNRGRR